MNQFGGRIPSIVIGIGLITISLFALDITNPHPLHQLWLPLCLAAGALLVTAAPLAVALAVCALSAVQIDLSSTYWVERIAYPVLTGVGGLICLAIGINRFRLRIQQTRAERWANRTAKHPDSNE